MLSCTDLPQEINELVSHTVLVFKYSIVSSSKMNNFVNAVDMMPTSGVTCKCPRECGDLTYQRLMIPRGNNMMHLFYENAAVAILEVPAALATCDAKHN
jgi:hypothetical protein